RSAFLYDHNAAHHSPMTWKSAHEWILTWLLWSGKFQRVNLSWINQRRGEQHFRHLRNIMFFRGFRIRQHGISGSTNFVEASGLTDQQVVLHAIQIVKLKNDFLPRF